MSINGFFPCNETRTKHIIALIILLSFFLLQAHIITLIATNDTSGSQPSDFTRVSTKNSTLEADNNTLPNGRDRQDTQVKLAWLMSYPNSGTSYTMHLIQRASATTVATNYRQESYAHLQKGQPQLPVPVLTTSPGGPFVLSPEKPLPQTYIMTKTHCGSRCVNCSASKFVETKDSFLKQCSGGKDSSFGAYFYDPELVKRSIHLIRNPFDNVVSNFHLAAKRKAYSEYGNNVEGFRQWCADLDSKHAEEDRKSGLIPESIFDTFQDLPCHKVFYTFTQWHNLALSIQKDLKLSKIIIFYEDYEVNFNHTVHKILDFLELPVEGEITPFHKGKTYTHYFLPEERKVARGLMERLADESTWALLQRYFHE